MIARVRSFLTRPLSLGVRLALIALVLAGSIALALGIGPLRSEGARQVFRVWNVLQPACFAVMLIGASRKLGVLPFAIVLSLLLPRGVLFGTSEVSVAIIAWMLAGAVFAAYWTKRRYALIAMVLALTGFNISGRIRAEIQGSGAPPVAAHPPADE